MEKSKLLVSIVLVVVILSTSTVLALDPMGSPTASKKKGQLSAGAEYSYSEMDIKLNEGKYTGGGILNSFKSKDFRMNRVYANIGYGITNNWEAFLRLGSANASLKNNNDFRLTGDGDFAIGFGTKTTFFEKDKLKLGGLFQASWAHSDAEKFVNYTPYAASHMWSDEVHIDITEIQIALGPCYQLLEGISLYGGPFIHIVDGNVDGKWHNLTTGAFIGDESYDIDGTGRFGGYVGTQVEFAENISFSIEYQHTAAANALGMGLICRF
jgi:hypothetical protein